MSQTTDKRATEIAETAEAVLGSGVWDFLSVNETAALLDVHRTTVIAEIQRGRLKATRVGARFRISIADLVEYRDTSFDPAVQAAQHREIEKLREQAAQLIELRREAKARRRAVRRQERLAEAQRAKSLPPQPAYDPSGVGQVADLR